MSSAQPGTYTTSSTPATSGTTGRAGSPSLSSTRCTGRARCRSFCRALRERRGQAARSQGVPLRDLGGDRGRPRAATRSRCACKPSTGRAQQRDLIAAGHRGLRIRVGGQRGAAQRHHPATVPRRARRHAAHLLVSGGHALGGLGTGRPGRRRAVDTP